MRAQAVRSRAAFKRTLEYVRKHMRACTRDIDLAAGNVGRAFGQRPEHNPWGPAAENM